MKKLFMLAIASIRKTKGHTISLIIMFFIASLLLNAGLLVNFNFAGFYEDTMKELNTSNVYYCMSSKFYSKEVENYISGHENLIEMQKEDSLWGGGSINYKKETRDIYFLINDAEHERSLSKWKFIGEHLPLTEMSIYVSSIFQQDGGYELNDKFEVELEDETLTFTIKGFFEDIYFSSLESGVLGFYVSNDTFTKLSEQLGDTYKASLVYSNLKELNKDIETGIKGLTNLKGATLMSDIGNTLLSVDSVTMKLSRVLMAGAVSSILVIFAVIIVIVCLIVVRFRIGNSIEDDITKIGSLKAIGYTSKQIVFSVVLQFIIIALGGSLVGIATSYLTTPVISDVLAQQSGLRWEQGFDGIISSVTFAIILFFVAIISFFAAGRINKLNPIVALRGGIVTHNFKRNWVPLHTSIGSLPFVLALKFLLQNKKQSIMIAIIMITVSFAGTFAVVLYYNSAVDTRRFLEVPGVELASASIAFFPDQDLEEYRSGIKTMPEVRKVLYYDQVTLFVDGNEVNTFVMEDYSTKETNTIYKGRYPLHGNEIALAGHLSEMLDKEIGDNVTLKIGDQQKDFVVTGLTQGAFMGGINASITYDGALQLNPEFKQINLQIYLKENSNSGEFIEKIKSLYGDTIGVFTDINKSMEQGAGAYSSIISKIGVAILVITIVIVILVLYFVINSSVTRRRRELGIQKAIGFTTFQLMNQLSLGFLPPIMIGVFLGCILGIRQLNPAMSVFQSSMGVMKTNYIIIPEWVAVFGAAIVIVSYIASMLITYRIRKISAYTLVSE